MVAANITEADPLIGQRLGSYSVERLVGRGGMSRVYEGFDDRLRRRAALKVMDGPPDHSVVMTARFVREARTIANLEHPNIVSIYEFGDEPVWYIAMKFLEGETLLSRIARLRHHRKFVKPGEVISIVTQVAAALDYAHKRGVLHRDIKPGNIMLARDGRTILMDFGLAMRLGAQSTPGTTLGTPRYIAPEQAMSSQQSVPQSDIYSLAIVLYEMVTGQTPFNDEAPMQLALSHVTTPPPLPQSLRRDVPPAVQTVILKALEKRPENRWQSAKEMADALRNAYAGKEPKVFLSQRETNDTQPMVELPIPASADEETMLMTPPVVEAAPTRRRSGQWLTFVTVCVIGLALFAFYTLTARGVQPNQSAAADAPPGKPKLRLIYSPDSFVIYNGTSDAVSLEGVSFVRNDVQGRSFSAAKFGDSSHKALPAGQCLRIASTSADEESAPLVCKSPFRLLAYQDLMQITFWAIDSRIDQAKSFRIERNGQIVHECSMRLNTCDFALP